MKKTTHRIIIAMLICMTLLSAMFTVFAAAEETAIAEAETIETAVREGATSDSFSWDDIWNTFRDAWEFVVQYRDTILGGLSTAVSALAVFIVQRAFKPSVKKLKKTVSDFIEGAQKNIDALTEKVDSACRSVEGVIEDYQRMKEDKHTSDAFAQICHEQSLLLHKVIVQSQLSQSIKEEADRIYAESEKVIGNIIEGVKGGDECEA